MDSIFGLHHDQKKNESLSATGVVCINGIVIKKQKVNMFNKNEW